MTDRPTTQYTPTGEDVKTALDEWQWSRRMHIPEISTMDGDELHRNYLAQVTTKAKAEGWNEGMEAMAEAAEYDLPRPTSPYQENGSTV